MNQKEREMLDELRVIRDDLESDFSGKNMGNQKTTVKDIIYVGDVKWKDKINGNELSENLYIVKKEITLIGKDGKQSIREVSNYYLGDKCIGGFLGDCKEPIFDERFKLSEPDKIRAVEELLQRVDEKVLEVNSLENLEKKELEEISEKLGISPEDIKKMSEMDVEDIEQADEELQNVEEKQPDEEKETLSKKEVEKISTKTEISMNQKVTDKATISDLLGVQGDGYTKIAVIYSDKLQDRENTTKFSFVGIRKDGTAEKLDSLKQSHGINSSISIQQVNRDGSQVEEKQPDSLYTIEGARDGKLAIDIGPMGTIETSYVRVPEQDNQVGLGIPIETQSIRPTTNEVRELMNEKKNPRVMEEIERADLHQEHGDEEVKIQDIDDNPYNNECKNVEVDNEYFQKCIDGIWTGDVEAVFTRREVEKSLQNAIDSNMQNLPFEQIVKKVKQELEYDAEMMPSREKL